MNTFKNTMKILVLVMVVIFTSCDNIPNTSIGEELPPKDLDVGFWDVQYTEADELKGTKRWKITSFLSNEVSFSITDSGWVIIGSPNGWSFEINTFEHGYFYAKVTIGLYDTNMNLVQKLEHLAFIRDSEQKNYIFSSGQISDHNGASFTRDLITLYIWATENKGYIRILAERIVGDMDVTIPTIRQSQSD